MKMAAGLWWLLMITLLVPSDIQASWADALLSRVSSLPKTFYLGFTPSVSALPKIIYEAFQQGIGDKCYGELGCLHTTKEWYDSNRRPLNLTPAEREEINTQFILFTRQNPKMGRTLYANKTTIDRSYFNGRKRTIFIIHGLSSSGLVEWIQEGVQGLLRRGNWNIIVVDWNKGAELPYNQAAVNTRVVALEMSYLLNFLKNNYGLRMSNVYLVGHSLGAHTAGYVGQQIRGISRITGLDPAEPYFQGMPHFVRLDPTDAAFVDVIHTDTKPFTSIIGGGYGLKESVGHMDFYPNGQSSQPGCQPKDLPLLLFTQGITKTGYEIPTCSHIRAAKLYVESITSSCPFVGFQCESYDKFLQGSCLTCGSKNENCAVMGFDASEHGGSRQLHTEYYLSTGSLSPYCQYHYKVVLMLAPHGDAKEKVEGQLTISLYGDQGMAKDIPLTAEGARKMEHGNQYSFLGVHAVNVGRVSKVELSWMYDSSILHTETICIFCKNQLYVSRIDVTNLGSPPPGFKTSSLCSPRGKQFEVIESRTSKLFVNKC